MNDKNERLYNYIVEHSQIITDKWLAARKEQEGSIYSSEAAPDVEALLREQNTLTNRTVASALLEDQSLFEANRKEWARIVAESRINSNTPIYEVLDALNKVREVYWDFVSDYIAENGDSVGKENILYWSKVIHGAFDSLLYMFSELYDKLMYNRLNAQQELIHELSTPVIPIVDGTAVLPLVGEIDTYRAKHMLESVSERCSQAGINHLFVDLSGVMIVDTMVASQIYHLIYTLELLGVKTTISGIRPEVAQTSVQLGVDFSQVRTFSTLKQALQRSGVKLNPKGTQSSR